jgi:adenine/guanine/hypoxanthine permease
LKLIEWDDVTEAAPAVVTALMMPLTFSIANGIALGFVTYAILKALSGRWSDLNPSVVIIAVVFILKFIFLDAA